jgi:hypothetical protein
LLLRYITTLPAKVAATLLKPPPIVTLRRQAETLYMSCCCCCHYGCHLRAKVLLLEEKLELVVVYEG